MKNLFKLSAFAAALLTSSAYASTITIDADLDGNSTNGTTVTDMVTSTFNATSYYVDEDGSGFVDNGEFVFDFGLGIDVTGFSPASVPAGYLTDWKFQADYLIYGNAVVQNTDASVFGQGILGSDDGAYNDFGQTTLQFVGDVNNENLSANILDGLLNLFIVELDGTGNVETGNKTLAASYDVESLLPRPGQIVLDMELDGLWAMDDLFYNSQGVEYNAAVDAGGTWAGLLTSQFFAGPNDAPIPGQWINAADGDASSGEKAADGSPLAYYGKNATQVTANANDCPTTGTFGWCSNNSPTATPLVVQQKWESVRETIRTASKDGNGDSYKLLARSTTLGSRLTQDVPEPTSIAILALGMLGFAASRKRNIKK